MSMVKMNKQITKYDEEEQMDLWKRRINLVRFQNLRPTSAPIKRNGEWNEQGKGIRDTDRQTDSGKVQGSTDTVNKYMYKSYQSNFIR